MKEQDLIVMKFGGKSVENTRELRHTAEIIKDYSRDDKVVVVVSAIYGVTDQLSEVIRAINSGWQWHARGRIIDLYQLHSKFINILGLHEQRFFSESLHRFRTDLLPYTNIPQQLQPSQEDFIASYGERLSYLLLAETMGKLGVRNQPIDATNIIMTDNEYGNAKVDLELSHKHSHHHLKPLLEESIVPVIGGFYGLSQEGKIAVLGRGGSDYTAAVLANILDARKLILWKDVDGIYSEDPIKNPFAEFLSEISYDQAEDLARYKGAKILHPESIYPLRMKNIPIELKNFNYPNETGSIITGNLAVETT